MNGRCYAIHHPLPLSDPLRDQPALQAVVPKGRHNVIERLGSTICRPPGRALFLVVKRFNPRADPRGYRISPTKVGCRGYPV